MKIPSNKLFRLVKSLSGSEKRYFKIFIKNFTQRESKYLQLFEEIEKQEIFDDIAIQEKLYREKKIETRKYSELKAYLYNLILKSLQFYDEKSSVDYRIKGKLLNIRSLFKRGLYDDCKILLNKAKKLAKRYEYFASLLEILKWEKTIAHAQTNISILDKVVRKTEKEEKSYLQHLEIITVYRNLFLHILLIVRKDASRPEKQIQKIRELIKHPLLNEENKTLSNRSFILYHRIYSMYYYSQSDYQKFYDTNKILVDFFEDHAEFLFDDHSDYISSLSNYVFSCGWLKKYDEAEKALLKMKRIKPKTPEEEQKLFRQYFNIKLGLCIVKGDFNEGLSEIKKFFKIRAKFDQSLFKNNTFLFQFFYIYFGVNDYDNATYYLNEWLNSSKKLERTDLQSLARILNIILHYEMGNTILLESLSRSLIRKHKNSSSITEYEKIITAFFNKIINEPKTKKEEIKAFENLKKEITLLSKNAQEKSIIELFDINSWLQSKIEKRPFRKMIKEKFTINKKLKT